MAKNTIDLQQLDKKVARNTKSDSYFGKGITLAAGFDLGAKGALDTRATVKTIAERDAHVTGNRAYEGMLVYVEETKVTYQYTGTEWREFGFNSSDFEQGIINDLTTGGVDKALSAEMGKLLNTKLTEQSGQLTAIDGKVDTVIDSIEGLESDLETHLTEVNTKIDANKTAIEAEVTRATTAEGALQSAIDAEEARAIAIEEGLATRLDTLEGDETVEGSVAKAVKDAKDAVDADMTALATKTTADIATAKTEAITESKAYTDAEITKINTATGSLVTKVEALEAKDVKLEGAISAVDTKAEANKTAIAKEVSDREAAITTVTEKVTNLEGALATETAARIAGDQALQTNIDAVDTKVEDLKTIVDGIETTWDAVTGKPFETVGKTLTVSADKTVDVKVDGTTVEAKADGSLAVKDGVFAPLSHNHDSAYASKNHELNTEIHLTSDEKVNVGKIPAIETDVNLLKTTVGASSAHIIVATKAELEGLIATANHATIAHVIETKETYILEKDSDINGNAITPEWIKLSDSDALVSVDWSVINNKPFSTVTGGLVVEGDAIKVSTDGTTVEVVDNKVKVKDGVFAEAGHTHVVDFNDVVNKPTTFTKEFAAANFVDGTGLDEGLCYITVEHGKNSRNLKVTAIGSDNLERLIGIEFVDNNTIKVWSDEKETLNVSVFSFDFVTNSTPEVPVDVATVGFAKVGVAKVGKAKRK